MLIHLFTNVILNAPRSWTPLNLSAAAALRIKLLVALVRALDCLGELPIGDTGAAPYDVNNYFA
jgi:hypothetical protein